MIIDIYAKKRPIYGGSIIENVHLHLMPGTSTLILGTSGAGKSTLIKCITGETRFSGSVKMEKGENRIAYIAQKPAINERETVEDSIFYTGLYDNPTGDRKEIEMRTNRYISMLGLEFVRGQKIKSLSGGQRQRVAIAREMLRNADVLICDEPDSGLDAGVSYVLSTNIQRITKEDHKTTIVISHNVVNAKLYDNILVICKTNAGVGGVAYFGPPQNALSYFGVKNYYEILLKINSESEGGIGEGDYYIRQFINRHQ